MTASEAAGEAAPEPAAPRLGSSAPLAEPSTWQRFAPQPAWTEPRLAAIERALDAPAMAARLAELEAEARYPDEALERLRALGLADLLLPPPGREPDPHPTVWHLSALNELAARRSGSLAITLGVNALALLPAYIAATPEQLAAIAERVHAGAFASMLLSELDHGSNLLRNEARAEPGFEDGDGRFVALDPADPAESARATSFRLTGEKHMINGGQRHGLLFALMRTRGGGGDPRGAVSVLGARADFSLFWVDRGPGVEALPRWRTLPAQSADISGVRFAGAVVPRARRIGRDGGGFALIQSALSISRGAIAALACGALGAARQLAFAHARARNVYGEPIARLPAIALHLQRLDALERLAAAISLKAVALTNAAGLGAAYYTAIAKLSACELAEEGVTEGRRVLSARALVREHPYERVVRDVLLYGVFDGTSHVMLEEIGFRLEQLAREAGAGGARPEPGAAADASADTLARMREAYAAAPAPLVRRLRERRRAEVLPLDAHLDALAAIEGDLDAGLLPPLARALFVLVRSLVERGAWKREQGIRFEAGRALARLEALAALVELFDPARRRALGVRAPANVAEGRAAGAAGAGADGATPADLDLVGARFALAWLGGALAARLRALALEAGLAGMTGPGREGAEGLVALEARALAGFHDLTLRFREGLAAGV